MTPDIPRLSGDMMARFKLRSAVGRCPGVDPMDDAARRSIHEEARFPLLELIEKSGAIHPRSALAGASSTSEKSERVEIKAC
jgi:hypothetical protein